MGNTSNLPQAYVESGGYYGQQQHHLPQQGDRGYESRPQRRSHVESSLKRPNDRNDERYGKSRKPEIESDYNSRHPYPHKKDGPRGRCRPGKNTRAKLREEAEGRPKEHTENKGGTLLVSNIPTRRECREDKPIPVFDPILLDPRFNFFDLPSKAKVLLISNIPEGLADPPALFALLSVYGYVTRIKMLRKRTDAALAQFSTATMAAIARNHLDGLEIKDKTLAISVSRFEKVLMPGESEREMNEVESGDAAEKDAPRQGSDKTPEADQNVESNDGSTVDFLRPEYDKVRNRRQK